MVSLLFLVYHYFVCTYLDHFLFLLSAAYPSTIRYPPPGKGNTSLDSSNSSSDIPSTSIPLSSKYSRTSFRESTTSAMQSSRKASASSIVSATGSEKSCPWFFKKVKMHSSLYSFILISSLIFCMYAVVFIPILFLL